MGEIPAWAVIAVGLAALVGACLANTARTAVRWAPRDAVERLPARRRNRAAAVERILDEPVHAVEATGLARLLAEALTFVCVTLALVSTPLPWWAAGCIAVLVCVVVWLPVVQLLARRIGRARPVRVLAALAPGIVVLMVLSGPLARALAASRERAEEDVTGEDLLDLVDRVTDSDAIEDDEREMLHSVFELGGTLTREVMVPRTDMITVEAGTPQRKAMSLFLRSGYSRIPVVGQEVDDLLGMAYLKDVARRIQADPRAAEAPVAGTMRPAIFVPESKPVDDLLRELQNGESHIAMVVDEYGGIAGLVTIEDVLEEIVGELTDEHDPAAHPVEDLGEGRWRVPARMPLDELGDLFDTEIEDDEVDTVGGLLAKTLGKVPLPGARADVHGLHLEAERTEGRRRRLATVVVGRCARPESEGDPSGSRVARPPDAETRTTPARPAGRGQHERTPE